MLAVVIVAIAILLLIVANWETALGYLVVLALLLPLAIAARRRRGKTDA